MEGSALIGLVLVLLALAYKLGLFRPIINLADVATRESDKYNREHKVKVAKSYLAKDLAIAAAEVKKINDNIKAIDELAFD